MTDSHLVARAQEGDLPAFEELVKKYQREVYGLACRIVTDSEEAKDLSQQAFLQAFVHIRSFRQQAQFRTWLFRIAINQCYNYLKSKKKFGDPVDTDEYVLVGEGSPDEDLVAQEDRRRLQAAQEAPAAPAPRRFKLPYYLLGAPAVALLLLWLGAHLMESHSPVPGPGPKVAQKAGEHAVAQDKARPASPPAPQVAHTKAPEQVQPVSLGLQKKAPQPSLAAQDLADEEFLIPDDEFSSWDPEPVLSELSEQEREILLQKLRLREKDGSCATIAASVSWA
jgi:RNA polymerase sigma factor (sigma-70 family)